MTSGQRGLCRETKAVSAGVRSAPRGPHPHVPSTAILPTSQHLFILFVEHLQSALGSMLGV